MSHLETIASLEAHIAEGRRHLRETIERLQASCPHPEIAIREGDYSPESTFFSASPPFRVCIECGYAEEGWGCGYWKLRTKGPVPMMDRNYLMKNYVKRFINREQLSDMRFGRESDALGR